MGPADFQKMAYEQGREQFDGGSRSIGSGNQRGNAGIRVTFDPAHGDDPNHVDMTVPIPGLCAHKIKVRPDGSIFYDEIV